MTDDDTRKKIQAEMAKGLEKTVGSMPTKRVFELVKKHVKEILKSSDPVTKVEFEDFDPDDPTTIRMKVSLPLPYINVTLNLDDPEADNLRLRSEIAAARMLESGEWRPFYAGAILLREVTKKFNYGSTTELRGSAYKESIEISSDPVKWAKRMIELDVQDPAEVYLSRFQRVK